MHVPSTDVWHDYSFWAWDETTRSEVIQDATIAQIMATAGVRCKSLKEMCYLDASAGSKLVDAVEARSDVPRDFRLAVAAMAQT